MASTTPRSVATPKQARSEQTQKRLLDAAQALIETQGLHALSIPEIVRAARSSVGGFYARFGDKDALLRALEERFFKQLAAQIEAATAPEQWREASLEQVVHGVLRIMVTTYGEHGRLLKAFIVRSAQDPQTWRDGLRLRNRVSERMSALVLHHRGDIAHPQPERAMDLAVKMVLGVMQQKAIFGEVRAAGEDLSDEELVSELATAVLAYLGAAAVTA